MAGAETVITENLDTWSSAIKAKSASGRGGGKKQALYGIKKLRELILELAVRGLLVPQDQEDEPASELLKRISNRRKRLLDAGKIKKQKAIPSRDREQYQENLPKGWITAQFGDVVFNRDAQRIPLSVSERKTRQGGFDYYGASGVIDSIDDYLFEKPLLLIGEDGANLLNRSSPIAFLAKGKYWVNNHAHVLDGLTEGLLEFVCLHINAISLKPYVTGTAQPKMNQAKMNSIVLCLPPEQEQHRIVAKVDELMALCDQLEQQQEGSLRTHETLVKTLLGALTAAGERGQFAEAWKRIESNFDTLFTTESSIDELKQTILQLAVMGKLVPFIPIGSDQTVADHINFQNGYAFKSTWFEPDGIRLCRNVNVSHGTLDWREEARVSHAKGEEFNRFLLSEGDIVLSLDRPLITSGLKIARIRHNDLPCLLLQRVAKPIPKHTDISLDFLYLWFNSPAFVDSIDPGRSNGIPHISTRQVLRLPLHLPPLAEQHRIVAKVDGLMALCDRLKASLKAAQETQLNLADCLVEKAVD